MLTLFADWFTYTLLRLPKGRLITEAIHFFVYDIPKIYLLLVVIVFVVAMLRTWIPAEKIKRLLVHRHQFVGNILASSWVSSPPSARVRPFRCLLDSWSPAYRLV